MSTYEIGTYYLCKTLYSTLLTGRRIHLLFEKKMNARTGQGLLELLWMVYSKGKLQSCLKLRNFQNPTLNKDKSVGHI